MANTLFLLWRDEAGKQLTIQGLTFPACFASMLDHVIEFWPVDEGGSNIYHFCIVRALKNFPCHSLH